MSQVAPTIVNRSSILQVYKSILREGRKLPIYSRRRYVSVKAKTDFLAYKDEKDAEVIQRQFQLAEDMLDSLSAMGESQRQYFAWEDDPISHLPDGRPQRRQPPPRDIVTENNNPQKPKADDASIVF